jgi:alkylation response protein AidB-like acyl-CoA dehydrogenase
VPIAISAEQRALAASLREWATRAGTLALVRALEPGSGAGLPGSPPGAPGSPDSPAGVTHEGAPWAEHWAALAGLGIFSIALPGGGSGCPRARKANRPRRPPVPWPPRWPPSPKTGGGPRSPTPAGDAGYAFLLSRCLSIAGGTSQILLSVVAERALGLPREEAR